MTRLSTTRDTYGPHTTGGLVTRIRPTPRRLSAPRERTLTELGLRDTRFDVNPVPHHMIQEWECAYLRCAFHDKTFDLDCGD